MILSRHSVEPWVSEMWLEQELSLPESLDSAVCPPGPRIIGVMLVNFLEA